MKNNFRLHRHKGHIFRSHMLDFRLYPKMRTLVGTPYSLLDEVRDQHIGMPVQVL